MKAPNFLIVSSGKCGTTSIYYALKEHPEVCMSQKKELFYFCESKKPKINLSWEEYLDQFHHYTDEKAIGELGISYLIHHKKAIRKIKEKLKDPKIIIVIRNPIERAFSSYLQTKNREKSSDSFIESFYSKRRYKNGERKIWHDEGSLYYEGIKNYIDNFTNIYFLLFEDFIGNPLKSIQQIYEFLGVDPMYVPSFKARRMATGIVKSKFKDKLINSKLNKYLKPLARTFGLEEYFKKFLEIQRAKNLEKPSITDKEWQNLQNFFKKDVEECSKLIGIDLNKRWGI
jgi:hypothetical protein